MPLLTYLASLCVVVTTRSTTRSKLYQFVTLTSLGWILLPSLILLKYFLLNFAIADNYRVYIIHHFFLAFQGVLNVSCCLLVAFLKIRCVLLNYLTYWSPHAQYSRSPFLSLWLVQQLAIYISVSHKFCHRYANSCEYAGREDN